jgi:hypothetical protein
MSQHKEEERPPSHRIFEACFIASEIVVIILYFIFVDYGPGLGANDSAEETIKSSQERMQSIYPMW